MSDLAELIKEYRRLSHKRQSEPHLFSAEDVQRIGELKTYIDQRLAKPQRESGGWTLNRSQSGSFQPLGHTQSSGGWATKGLTPPQTPPPLARAALSESIRAELLEDLGKIQIAEEEEEISKFQASQLDAFSPLPQPLVEVVERLQGLEGKRREGEWKEAEERAFRGAMDRLFVWLPRR